MICVMDASAGIEIALKRTGAADLVKYIMAADKVIAPDVYVSEIANTMWKLNRNNKDGLEAYYADGDFCINLISQYVPATELWKDALIEAKKNNHPVYDMLYFVLARRYGARFLTCDKKLQKLYESF